MFLDMCIISYERNLVFVTISDFLFPNIFATQCRRPLIFQTMTSIRLNNISYNIKGLRHWVLKIEELEKQSLWQRLNSFKVKLLAKQLIRSNGHGLTFY